MSELLQQLANQLTHLERLGTKLSHDPDIQAAVRIITTKSQNGVASYNGMMISEGNVVLAQKELLMSTQSPNDVAVTKMSTSLASLTSRLTQIRNDVTGIQGSVNADIEECRARKRKHEASITAKQATFTSLQDQISTSEQEIVSCTNTAASFEQSAQELDNRAGDIERAARRKRKRGRFGFIGAAVGLVLAPVTGLFVWFHYSGLFIKYDKINKFMCTTRLTPYNSNSCYIKI